MNTLSNEEIAGLRAGIYRRLYLAPLKYMSRSAALVYDFLAVMHTKYEDRGVHLNGEKFIHISLDAIAHGTGYSRRTASSAIGQLRALGIVRTERLGINKHDARHFYHVKKFSPPSEASPMECVGGEGCIPLKPAELLKEQKLLPPSGKNCVYINNDNDKNNKYIIYREKDLKNSSLPVVEEEQLRTEIENSCDPTRVKEFRLKALSTYGAETYQRYLRDAPVVKGKIGIPVWYIASARARYELLKKWKGQIFMTKSLDDCAEYDQAPVGTVTLDTITKLIEALPEEAECKKARHSLLQQVGDAAYYSWFHFAYFVRAGRGLRLISANAFMAQTWVNQFSQILGGLGVEYQM